MLINPYKLKPMHLEELIRQLTELLEKHGNREVVVKVNIEVNDDFDTTDWSPLGYPREANFDVDDGKVKIHLQNYFEV